MEQYLVLKYRSLGFTQLQTAQSLEMTRANVSMIESRAKKKIAHARATIAAYESILASSKQIVTIPKGTAMQQVPSLVYQVADSRKIRLKANLVDITRMVRSYSRERLFEYGATIRPIKFEFTENGTLSIVGSK